MADEAIVLYKIENGIARVTLNRPDKRNALNDALVANLKDALRLVDESEDARACIITGAGKDFCSGADLSALQKIAASDIVENLEDAQSLGELFKLIRRVRVPVIAAVRGRALAGGCGLATACDIVLACASARFGYPEVKIGFVPAMVAAITKRNVSEKQAFELLTCGAEIEAAEATRIGLINRVYEDEAFDEEVENFVARFEKTSRSAVMLTKRLLYEIDGMSFEKAIDAGVDTNAIARFTDDCRKGIAGFLNNKNKN